MVFIKFIYWVSSKYPVGSAVVPVQLLNQLGIRTEHNSSTSETSPRGLDHNPPQGLDISSHFKGCFESAVPEQ